MEANFPTCGELPAGVDLVVFDMSVNRGPRRAVRMLREAVGVTADSLLGPVTRCAVTISSPAALIDSLADARQRFYETCGRSNGSQPGRSTW